jgi:hypothetical protein
VLCIIDNELPKREEVTTVVDKGKEKCARWKKRKISCYVVNST